LGINELRMDATSRLSYQKIQQAYEDQELERIEEQVLFLTIKGYSGDSWIRQDSTILQVPSGRIYLREYQNYGYYGNIGPLKEGMVEWFTKDTSIHFYFNPEMIYTLDSGRIATNQKTRLTLANARTAQTTDYFSFAEVLKMAELERRWFVEDSITEAEKNRKKIIQRPRTPSVNQFEAYQGHGGTSSLEIQDGDKALVQRDFIWMENLNDPRYSHYVQQGSYYFSTLKPGLYRLVTGSYQQEMIEVDSLVIDTLCRTFIRLDLLAKPLDPSHWASMQYHYFQTLNKYGPARVPIYDAYTLTQESASSNKKGEVSGTALINLGPASSAYVLFIHQNGQNRYLATANNQGHFRMYDMEAGRYWVQIISAQRQVFFAKEINLKNGSQLNLQLDCITDTSLIKKITPNFQNRKFNKDSAIYIDEEGQFASLEGFVYNVVNKERLHDAQIRVTLNGVIMGGARTDEEGYFHVCCLKPGKYQIEVLQGGYQNLIVKDVDLKKGKRLRYNYALLENELVSTYLWDFGDREDQINYTSVLEGEALMELPTRTMNSAAPSYMAGSVQNGFMNIETVSLSKKKINAGIEEDFQEGVDEKARLDEIARDPSANKIRKDFQTNAFWVPNLITGKDGKTAFTYTLPDDQTQWINYLVAINRKQQTNLNTSYTRSYKPLSASLRVPEFVVAGDKIEVAGTVRNLTGDSFQIVIRETLAGIQKEKTITVGGYLRETQRIEIPSGKDTLTLSYVLQYGNYIDGEERNIRVLSDKVYDRKVQTQLLGTGESIQINFNPEAVRRSIRLQSGLRDLLEEEIMNLKRYQYGCVEQTASKLYALLREIQLRRALNEVFNEKQEVVFLIKRLEEFQNKDGSWGWWQNSSGIPEMTLYVAKALLLADQEGFRVKGHKKGAGQLINTYAYLNNANKLATLLLARELGMKLDYELQVAELAKKNLSTEGKMYLIELQIRMGLPYSLKPITDNLKTDARGNVFMDGESRWGFNAQLISLSMQAYGVLRLAGGQESTLLNMRKFLFNNLGYVRRNTFERAAIINTLTEEIKASGGAIFQVKLGEKVLYTGGNYSIEGNSVNIENLGAGVSVIAIEEYESQANTKQIQGITLNTEFLVKNKGTYTVRSGEISTLHVQATVSKYQKYLVLNVPIPAGCQIISKPGAQGRETAREYFADHIVIYFEDLPKGEYTFDFYLLPQFNGSLTLMPALMEQMYEPEFFGREMKRTIHVE
ncbi:MAG: carboxypeptidase regulatory-like domain-containing protein, partial [Bacteroidia bacterium]